MATHKALPLGGNAGLNFDVVGGITSPTNPKDNTIWVNTSTPINKWTLSGKEPTSPTTGQVWVKTLNSGGMLSFNALKKNTIDTNISKVYQYDGTEWKAMSGSIYNNGTSILDYEPQTSSEVLSVSKAQSSSAVTAYSSTISIPSGYSSVVFTAYSHPTIYGTVKTSVIIDGATKNTRTSAYNGSGQSYGGSEITLNTQYACSTSIQLYLYLERSNDVSDSTATATFSVTYHFE